MIKLDPPNKTLFIDTEKELERLKDEIKNNDNEFFKMIKLDEEIVKGNQDNKETNQKRILN